MKQIFDRNYYVIHGWMINQLKLKGNELMVFAIIYGFSQDKETEYSAGLSYLMEWLDTSKPTIINILKSLCEKKYIERIDNVINNVNHVRYRVHHDIFFSLKYYNFEWSTYKECQEAKRIAEEEKKKVDDLKKQELEEQTELDDLKDTLKRYIKSSHPELTDEEIEQTELYKKWCND